MRTLTNQLVLGLLLSSSAALANSSTTTQPDNSRVNQRDKNTSSSVTADQQKNNRADLDITRQIRRSVVKDDALSTYAHNVKIVSQNGEVVLRGPVRSMEEKIKIERLAHVPGVKSVRNEIEVKTDQG